MALLCNDFSHWLGSSLVDMSKHIEAWTNAQHFADNSLTYWGRVTHICVSKLTIIGSNNGLKMLFVCEKSIILSRPQWVKWKYRASVGMEFWFKFQLNLCVNISSLVQVMVWCHEAASHYLNHLWPRSLLSAFIVMLLNHNYQGGVFYHGVEGILGDRGINIQM